MHPPPHELLATPLSDEVIEHLAGCARCRVDLRRLATFQSEGATVVTASDSLSAAAISERDLRTAHDELSNRYDLHEEVGRGQMGVVYRGRHRQLDRPVAIKMLLPGTSVERFRHEAQALARLRSPHIVAVLDFDILANGIPFLAMEWVDGSTLAAHMKQHPEGISLDAARRWMTECASGLRACEDRGIRDIKPSNLLIDERGAARLVDFGLARDALRAGGSEAGLLMGTPLYMSPEQTIDPGAVDARADLYSLGATFYHAVTSRPPFVADTIEGLLDQHRFGAVVAPSSIRSSVDLHFNDVLERCLAKAPSDRFQSFAELEAALAPGGTEPWRLQENGALPPVYMEQLHRHLDEFLGCSTDGAVHTFEFLGGRVLRVVRGRLERQDCDVVVSSDDVFLTMGGGVSAALRKGAGPVAFASIRRLGRVRPGRVAVSPGGDLKARLVFHAAVLQFGADRFERPTRDVLAEVVRSCLYEADTYDVRSIAFPLLGSGVGGFSPRICLETLFRTLALSLFRVQTSVREVRIVILPDGVASDDDLSDDNREVSHPPVQISQSRTREIEENDVELPGVVDEVLGRVAEKLTVGASSGELTEQLVRTFGVHIGAVRRHCRGALKGWPAEEVDEVVQDVLLTAWRNLGSHRHDTPLREFMLRTSAFCCANHRRRRARSGHHDATEAMSSELSALDHMLDRERAELVQTAMRRVLDDVDRAVVQLRYEEDASLETIASELGIDPSGVRVILQRAKRRLNAEIARLVREEG